MSRATFLARLRQGLQGLSPAEIDDIVEDYRAIFEEASNAMRSEPDLEASLGDPIKLGHELRRQAGTLGISGNARESAYSSPGPFNHSPKQSFRTATIATILALSVLTASALFYFAFESRKSNHSRKVSIPRAVRVTGSGVMDMGVIDQQSLTIDVRDDGKIIAAGKVGELTLRVTGHGSAKLRYLKAETVNAIIGDNGRAELAPIALLNAKLSGASVTTLFSQPKFTSKSISDTARLVEEANR